MPRTQDSKWEDLSPVANHYFVNTALAQPAAPLTQNYNWHDFPPDIQEMISTRVKANRIAHQRSERELRFLYQQRRTDPSSAQSHHLRRLVFHWGNPQLVFNAQLVEVLARQLFDLHFRLRPQASNPPTPNDDDVNITPAEWAQVVLRIVDIRRIDGPRGVLQNGEYIMKVYLASNLVPGQRQHKLVILLPGYDPMLHTDRPRMWMQYSGFLSWQTFIRPTGELTDRTILPGPVENQ